MNREAKAAERAGNGERPQLNVGDGGKLWTPWGTASLADRLASEQAETREADGPACDLKRVAGD